MRYNSIQFTGLNKLIFDIIKNYRLIAGGLLERKRKSIFF
jgi:hypothetical protein